MKRQTFAIAAGLALAAAGLTAQSGGQGGAQTITVDVAYQQAGTLGASADEWITGFPVRAAVGVGGQVVASRPLSAKEERKTVQTLGDGTELLNSTNNVFYRDTLGRTRVEQTINGKKNITIQDPVNGWLLRIDPEAKTALKNITGAGRGGRGGTGSLSAAAMEDIQKRDTVVLKLDEAQNQTAPRRTTAPAKPDSPQSTNEDLGIESVNGVPALHTRTTLTIPAGQIGNNRDIHVVNERWYSDDLQMLIKSVNSDPRFGVTTYQLTDIVRADPDPSLFMVPGDYTVTEPAGRGGALVPTMKKQQQ